MLIPVLIVRDVPETIIFFTKVLDFELGFAMPSDTPFYAVLTRGADELHLNLAHEKKRSGESCVIVLCDDIDELFSTFIGRGLSVPIGKDSPAHAAPLNQTWGTREVYIDDPSGNTIIYQQRK